MVTTFNGRLLYANIAYACRAKLYLERSSFIELRSIRDIIRSYKYVTRILS